MCEKDDNLNNSFGGMMAFLINDSGNIGYLNVCVYISQQKLDLATHHVQKFIKRVRS